MKSRSAGYRFALIVAVGVVTTISTQREGAASASSRYLCTSIPTACAYTPPTAPVLRQEVCFDGVELRLRTAASCEPGARTFYVDYGEIIDPLNGVVLAYVPLDDACDVGYCVQPGAGHVPGVEGALCCSSDSCKDHQAGARCTGQILYCADKQEPQPGGGGWECVDS